MQCAVQRKQNLFQLIFLHWLQVVNENSDSAVSGDFSDEALLYDLAVIILFHDKPAAIGASAN